MIPRSLCFLLSVLIVEGLASKAIARELTQVPVELKQLIPPDKVLLDYQTSDLNGDGRADYVFVLESKTATTQPGGDGDIRTLKIATRQANGKLTVVKTNNRVVLCRQCGGTMGDPFESLDAKPRSFSVNHYGGGIWRWGSTYSFAYSRRDDTWQLVEVEEYSFHYTNPDDVKNATYRPPKHFGKIDIADFDPEYFKGIGPR